MPEFNESRETANATVSPALLRETLLTEAHDLMRNPQVSAQEANERIDRAYTQSESRKDLSSDESALIKLDHATLLDIYGISHNNQEAKDKAETVLNSLPEDIKKCSAIQGALVQLHDNKPIDIREGRANAVAGENAAEESLKSIGFLSHLTLTGSSYKESTAVENLKYALMQNPEETKMRWSSFNRDHKYDSVMEQAENQLSNAGMKPPESTSPEQKRPELGAANELDQISKARQGEGDSNSVLFLKGSLMNALRDFDEDQNRELSKDELEAAENDARIKGDERTANALDFAGNNFANLQLSGKNDTFFSNHEGISREDISELNNYDSYLSNGNWLTTNPLVSDASVYRSAAIGATLGGIIQGLSYLTGLGQGITTYATYAGAAGGGLGLGGYGGYTSYEAGNSLPTTAGIGIGLGAFGAWTGGMAGALWGPYAGASLGGYGTQMLGEKLWNWRHRNEYESMYSQMRRL